MTRPHEDLLFDAFCGLLVAGCAFAAAWMLWGWNVLADLRDAVFGGE